MVTLGTGEPDSPNCSLVNSTTRLLLPTHRSPEGQKAMPPAPLAGEMVTVGTGEALASSALLYSTTVPLPPSLTHRLPDGSKARSPGPLTPAVITTSGRAFPVAPGR